jgi:hypothetical protein
MNINKFKNNLLDNSTLTSTGIKFIYLNRKKEEDFTESEFYVTKTPVGEELFIADTI